MSMNLRSRLTKGISSRDDGLAQLVLEEFGYVFEKVTHIAYLEIQPANLTEPIHIELTLSLILY